MKNIVSKLLFTGLVYACFASCSTDSIEEMGGKKVVDYNSMTCFSDEGPATRTAGKYVPQSSTSPAHVTFLWTQGDKIWVNTTGGTTFEKNDKDDISKQVATSNFYFTKNLTAESYKVRYTGTVSDKADEIVFAAKQKQTAPNSADLIGQYGDCGIATATKNANQKYSFNLAHKAGYLVLTPYSSVHHFDSSVGVRAVYVTANEGLTGTYTMAADGKLTKKTEEGKQIVWYYQQDVAGHDNIDEEDGKPFLPIPAASDASKNGIIIVLPPGEYTNLSIEYLLVDFLSGGKGYYKKSYKGTVKVEAGKPHYIAENIKLYEYDKNQYYTWDAATDEYFWKGHEDRQPILPGDVISYREDGFPDPIGTTDARSYNHSQGHTTTVDGNKALKSAADAMNVNEALWLVKKGSPMWDKTKLYAITCRDNVCHLFNTGVWFKTLKKIAADEGKTLEALKATAPNGTDYRVDPAAPEVNVDITSFGRPAKANTNADYMFLPCTGFYAFKHTQGASAQLETPYKIAAPLIGATAMYWTSSAAARSSEGAYALSIFSTAMLDEYTVSVINTTKYSGHPILFDNMGVNGPGKFRIK